jgi:hypothetical protein
LHSADAADDANITPIGGVDTKDTIIMRKRNLIVGGGSLAIACAAIATGALVSSNAMAASDAPTDGTATISVVSLSSDGSDPIMCTYDDIQLPMGGVVLDATAMPLGGMPEGAVLTGPGPVSVSSATVDASGAATVITGTDGSVPPELGTQIGAGSISITATAAAGGPGEISSVPSMPGLGAVVLSTDSARQGTAEECAALKPPFAAGAGMPAPTPLP